MTGIRKIIFPVVISVSALLIYLGWFTHPGMKAPSMVMEGVAQAQVEEKPPAAQTGGGFPEEECLIISKYPETIIRWCKLILQAAWEHELEPALLAALMLEESGGDPMAYSVSGAVGLLQVMPRDGIAANFQCINGPCFAARPSIDDLKDPAFNLDFGAHMLNGLVRRFGDLREALRAYGPMDVGYTYADTVLAIQTRYQ